LSLGGGFTDTSFVTSWFTHGLATSYFAGILTYILASHLIFNFHICAGITAIIAKIGG